MLDWYASLLALRHRYIVNGQRTCRVELAGGVIQMQVPRENPVLKVFARIGGAAPLPKLSVPWEKELAEEADGYSVSVWVEAPDLR